MSDSGGENSSRYSTFLAIVIAVVSVAGAVIAWRASVASSNAGSADMRGILALVDDQSVRAQAGSVVLGDQISFAAFKANDRLYTMLADVPGFETPAETFHSAARRALEDYIPQAYIDRNEQLDVNRALAQSRESLSYKKDTHPQPHFDQADQARTKANWMLFALIWLGFAIVCLTLADAIQNAFRHVLLVLGLGVFVLGTVLAALVELVG
ncbi:MAG: hypothetical protein HZB53_13130 [Chloroflexi bacterium]|nr:hypothetical protein [Chloroflexota bacterium]